MLKRKYSKDWLAKLQDILIHMEITTEKIIIIRLKRIAITIKDIKPIKYITHRKITDFRSKY